MSASHNCADAVSDSLIFTLIVLSPWIDKTAAGLNIATRLVDLDADAAPKFRCASGHDSDSSRNIAMDLRCILKQSPGKS
jgi:hypothetical protein